MRTLIKGLAFFAFTLAAIIVNRNVSAQDRPDMPGTYHDALYAADNMVMPVYGPYISVGGHNTVIWKIELDIYPHDGGHAVIMAQVVEEGGATHILRDFHSDDYYDHQPPWPNGQHFIYTGTITTNGSLRNRLVWLVRFDDLIPPVFFKNCKISVTYQ
jgi:hypothetical protein